MPFRRSLPLVVSWIAATVALAQPPVTVPSGTPLRVAIEQRVPIKHPGDPVRARLVEPVWVFDRIVLPAGSLVEGHISEIGGVPLRRRLTALLSGNLTPARDVHARFDMLALPGGSRLPIVTEPARGMAHTQRVPLLSRLKTALFAMLPYHRQAWPAGTLFSSALQQPVAAAPPPRTVAVAAPQSQDVSARLVTPLTSATARRGAPVEAVVTRPQFSPTDHRLLIPEGSRLLGDVVDVRHARRLHRNGKVLFAFRRLILPVSGAGQDVKGYLEGVEADANAHLALDSEGAIRAASPNTRFIFPAIAVAVAGLSLHQDFNAQGIPDQDIAGRAESGAVGLGLIGTVLAQASRTLASSIAFTGAAFSVYSTFLARGEDVVLPANTPLKIALRSPRPPGPGPTTGE